jgi:predicted transcriptional regulator
MRTTLAAGPEFRPAPAAARSAPGRAAAVMPSERSALPGLGPLETAVMNAVWSVEDWLSVRDIRDRMDYSPVSYTTVATAIANLYRKGLLARRLDDRTGKPGPQAWWYRAARSPSEHAGTLIAALLDHSPDPRAALDYALATARCGRRLGISPAGRKPSAGRTE